MYRLNRSSQAGKHLDNCRVVVGTSVYVGSWCATRFYRSKRLRALFFDTQTATGRETWTLPSTNV
jgi:hypothetical protein